MSEAIASRWIDLLFIDDFIILFLIDRVEDRVRAADDFGFRYLRDDETTGTGTGGAPGAVIEEKRLKRR